MIVQPIIIEAKPTWIGVLCVLYLNQRTNSSRDQNQQTGLLVQQIEEDDNSAETSPQHWHTQRITPCVFISQDAYQHKLCVAVTRKFCMYCQACKLSSVLLVHLTHLLYWTCQPYSSCASRNWCRSWRPESQTEAGKKTFSVPHSPHNITCPDLSTHLHGKLPQKRWEQESIDLCPQIFPWFHQHLSQWSLKVQKKKIPVTFIF